MPKMTRRQAMKLAQNIITDTAKMRVELKGALLLNYVLVQRAGGRVEVSEKEFADSIGKLVTAYDEERRTWVFLAAPADEPEQQDENGEPVSPAPVIEVVPR